MGAGVPWDELVALRGFTTRGASTQRGVAPRQAWRAKWRSLE